MLLPIEWLPIYQFSHIDPSIYSIESRPSYASIRLNLAVRSFSVRMCFPVMNYPMVRCPNWHSRVRRLVHHHHRSRYCLCEGNTKSEKVKNEMNLGSTKKQKLTCLVPNFQVCPIFSPPCTNHGVSPSPLPLNLRICDGNVTTRSIFKQKTKQITKSLAPIYLNSLISRLLSTTFFMDRDSFCFKSATSLLTFLCFLRIFTSDGRINIKICSVHSSDNNDLNSGLIALQI